MIKRTHCFAASVGFVLLPYVVCGQTPGTGHVQIKTIRSYSGAPLDKPASLVVYNFAATPEEVELNKGALNRVRTRVSGNQEDQKSKLADKIVDRFSESLVKDLEKTGIPVTRGVPGEQPPENSLAVQGDFQHIDEGNRARRMAIGLGAGASKVIANVECSLKQARKEVTIASFQATSRSSLKPGAAETMGAGAAPEAAAAVGGMTELKQGAEGDTDRMAKAIAKQITKTMTTQGWLEESK